MLTLATELMHRYKYRPIIMQENSIKGEEDQRNSSQLPERRETFDLANEEARNGTLVSTVSRFGHHYCANSKTTFSKGLIRNNC